MINVITVITALPWSGIMLIYLPALYVPKSSRYLINESKEKDEIEKREGKERESEKKTENFSFPNFPFPIYSLPANKKSLWLKLFMKYTKKFIIDNIKRA